MQSTKAAPPNGTHRIPVWQTMLAALTGALTLLIYFRQFWQSGARKVYADMADGQLLLALNEHWYRFLQGKEGWFETSFYYPAQGVLGYSDTFLMTGLLHALWRAAGADPYLSFQLSQFFLAALGFAGMFLWLRRFRALAFPFALFGAVLLILSSPAFFVARNSHIQLQSAWLIPWLIIGLELIWRHSLENPRRLFLSFTLTAVLYGLLAYSTFYIAWFALLYGLIFLAVATVSIGWRECLRRLRVRLPAWPYLLPGLLAITAWGILFLATYLPVRLDQGPRELSTILPSITQPWDLINHSESNLLWGNSWGALHEYAPELFWELELGPTLLLTLTCVVLAAGLLRQRFPFRGQPDEFVRLNAFVFLISLILLMRWNGIAPWILAYKVVPGGEAIRAVIRYSVFLMVPMTLLCAFGLQRIRQAAGRPFGTVLVLLLGSFILLEQFQDVEVARMDRAGSLATLERLPPPPPDATAFAVFGTDNESLTRDTIQSLAIVYSQHWDLPTVNGRSGFAPHHWGFWEPRLEQTFHHLSNWGQVNGITGRIYFFDVNHLAWSRSLVFPGNRGLPFETDLTQLVAPAFRQLAPEGWSDPEPWGVWNDGPEAILRFPALPDHPSGVDLEIDLLGFISPESPRQRVVLYRGENKLAETTLDRINPKTTLHLTIPVEHTRDGFDLRLRMEDARSPASLGMHADPRQLAAALTRLVLKSRP